MASAHVHPDIEVNFVFDGHFTYLHGGRVIDIRPLSFTVMWGGLPHQSLDTIHGGVWASIPLNWLLAWDLPGQLSQRLLAGEVIADYPDPADKAVLQRWVGDFASGDAHRRRALLLEVEARFIRLAMTDLPEPSSQRPEGLFRKGGIAHLSRIADYLSRHYQDSLTVPSVAEALELHPKYLMLVFKHHSGMSVWEYLTRLRLAHAQRVLLTTDSKVADVALDAGFGSMAAFYRAFATYDPGRLPLEYRRQVGHDRMVQGPKDVSQIRDERR